MHIIYGNILSTCAQPYARTHANEHPDKEIAKERGGVSQIGLPEINQLA